MICRTCGNQNAVRIHIFYDSESATRTETCDSCGALGNLYAPDVYFDRPYLDPNLVTPKDHNSPDGIWVESKRHKAQLLKEQGLRECGDRVHGARSYDPKIRH